jgi:hypothetical protein
MKPFQADDAILSDLRRNLLVYKTPRPKAHRDKPVAVTKR